jgi:hypothetical protein
LRSASGENYEAAQDYSGGFCFCRNQGQGRIAVPPTFTGRYLLSESIGSLFTWHSQAQWGIIKNIYFTNVVFYWI